MKMSMKMTLDGLMRALRWQAHDLAEQAERDYRDGIRIPHGAREAGGADIRIMGESDDRVSR